MLEGLRHAQVRFVVVGGVAGAVHGSSRVTVDLDICYDTAPDAVDRLARLLAGWDAYPREYPPGLPFFMDARTLRDQPTLTLTTREGALDLLAHVAGIGDYAAALARSVEIPAFGMTFRVLTLPALIDSKRAARRPKDLDHLPELEAILALRAESGGERTADE
jgi:hypothetical protein